MDKKEIRNHIRTLAKCKNSADKAFDATMVTDGLRDIIARRKPKIVAAFMPLADEIAIDIERLSTLCDIVIPRITQSEDGQAEMEFFAYDPAEIHSGAYGIDEPQGTLPISPDEIDLMILPGVAFTPHGDRLGRGKGFYDRYTAREGFHAYCIGVCYDYQILPSLPTEPHDRKVAEVITASR